MRQAIVTRYLGPTNFRGARVKASAQAGSVTIPWSHELDVDENHEKAAVALAFKFGWKYRKLAGGGLPDGKGNAYVMLEFEPLESTLEG